MRLSFRLREDIPDERLVIRWLQQQPGISEAVRAVLVAHVKGQSGVSMVAVNDKLDRLMRLVEGGVSLVVGAPSGAGEAGLHASDGLGFLDEMGL